MTDTEIIERDGRFLAGNSGNGGGSRNRLGEEFIKAIAQDFSVHGTAAAIERARAENAAAYLKICSDLLPKDAADKIAGAGSVFHACESVTEVIEALLGEFHITEAIGLCDELRDALVKRASDQARPIG
jgi:hypothetical protein